VSVREVAVALLGGAAVLLGVLAVAGVVAMRTALDRLHYAGAATAAGLSGAAAVVVAGGPSLIGTRAVVLAALLLATGPVLTHATAKAIHDRERDR
jgi:multicomponent Na+:H+ antiporter subunit G